MGWDGHEAGRGCRHDGASPSYKCFTCMPRHFCYPWLTPACFALLLTCSCGRFWCQLLALVSPNCVFEAVWARPLVRPAVLERSSDHLGFVKARCFIVVGYVAEASREKIAAHVAGLAQIVGSMCSKLQGLRGEQHGNHSGRWFRELSDLFGVLLDQVHANLFLHHTA